MRERLRDLTEEDYWVYGITERDFPHAIGLVREMLKARAEQWERHAERVRKEHPDVAEDMLDDPAYYRYTDEQYLWTFSLWRLQGLLEAVIAHQLLELDDGQRLPGLRAKLDAVEEAGYELHEEEREELIAWANLRNSLSHAPPEVFRPVPLLEEDIVEYHDLVFSLYQRWTQG